MDISDDYIYQFKYVPWSMIATCAIQIVMFTVYAIRSDETIEWDPTVVVGPDRCVARIYDGDEDVRWRFYPMVCYQAVHAGIGHVVNNVIGLALFGSVIEAVHGTWRTCLIYNSSVILGAAVFLGSNPSKGLVGSSGGVYGMLFCQTANLYYNWKNMMGSLKAIRIVAMLMFLSSDMYLYLHGQEQIAYLCHIAGGCTGSLLGLTLLKNITEEPFEKYMRYIGTTIFAISSSLAVGFWLSA